LKTLCQEKHDPVQYGGVTAGYAPVIIGLKQNTFSSRKIF